MEESVMGAIVALLAVLNLAPSNTAIVARALTGTWRSAVEETALSSSFDESVWGKNARSIRVVEMTVKPTGDATLTVTRRILDARVREITAATSIEYAEVTIGSLTHSIDVRSDLAATVKRAERRYPDDPKGAWPLEGMKVIVSTFADDPSRIEVRLDTPEGRGSFWETLRRGTRTTSTRS
jgi:hypothetical protein